MDATAPLPTIDAELAELSALAMRGARVVTRLMEVEQHTVDIVAAWLPEPGAVPATSPDIVQAGREVDGMVELLAQAVPRAEALSRAFERLARAVRFGAALRKRFDAGWPRAGSDTRTTMVRRQVARGVGQAITRETSTDTERAERLFDELALRLDDPAAEAEILALPVEQIVHKICRELDLATKALAAALPAPDTG